MRNLCKFISGVNQRLGGYAADHQASAADLGRFNDHRINIQLPGTNSADIATRTGANDQQFAGNILHGSVLNKYHGWRFEKRLDALDEYGGIPAVDNPVVEA